MPARTLPRAEAGSRARSVAPLAAAFDLVGDYVVITDADAHILYANRAMRRHGGYSMSALLGRNPADLWGGRMPKEFYENLWRNIKKEKKTFVAEVRNVTRAGRDCWHELHVSPVLDRRRRVQFFIAIEPSINDRKRKERFREELASIIGHQSLTPATTIRWMLEWLRERGGLTRSQQRALAEVYRANARLADMLKDLLFLSRLGRGYPVQERFDVGADLRGILRSKAHQYPRVRFSMPQPEREERGFPLATYRSLVAQFLSLAVEEVVHHLKDERGTIAVSLGRACGTYAFRCAATGTADCPRVPGSRATLLQMTARYLGWRPPTMRCGKGTIAVTARLKRGAPPVRQ